MGRWGLCELLNSGRQPHCANYSTTADSPDHGVGDKAQDNQNGQCDEHTQYYRPTIRLGRLEHVECPHRPNRDQGDADREQGRGGQNSQAVKLPTSLEPGAKHGGA